MGKKGCFEDITIIILKMGIISMSLLIRFNYLLCSLICGLNYV